MENPIEQKPYFYELLSLVVVEIPNITTLKLVKILYLIEHEYYLKFGEKLSEVPYVRITMGPVPSNYKSLIKRAVNCGLIRETISGNGKYYSINKEILVSYLVNFQIEFIKNQINILKKYNPHELKDISYETLLMKRHLKREKYNYGSIITRTNLFKDYKRLKDVDPLAKYRRAFIRLLKESEPYSEDDSKIDEEIYNEMAGIREYHPKQSRLNGKKGN